MSSTTPATPAKKLPSRLVKEINPAHDAAARDKILGARVALVLRHGFFGNLALRLKLVNADTWCETAATDGRYFYYNSQFINMLDDGQMMFLFCHELLHAAYEHMGRTGNRDRRLANIAMDYVVNADCINNGLGKKITVVPILYDRKYENWTWEAVYDDLYQNAKKISIEDLVAAILDDHLDGEDGKGGGSTLGDGDGNGRPVLSEEERQQIRDEFKEHLLAAAQATEGAGNIPGGLKRMLKDLTEPKIDWREFIRQQIQSTVKNDYTYAIPNRKNFHNGFSMPSMVRQTEIEISIGLDTSGSINDEMAREFFSEVKSICDTFENYKINLWCWDTAVHNPQEFTSHGTDDIMDYELAGYGGTDSSVCWPFMQENDINPKILLMFTDGYIYGDRWCPPGEEDYCPVVWIINNHSGKDIVPPFGQYCYYQDHK